MIRHRSSVVCQHDNRLLTVRAIDPVGDIPYLFLPGGAIETSDATPAAAAVRETLEETGYAVRLAGEPLVLDYQFLWSGKWYHCRTHFFRAELIDPKAAPVEVLFDPLLHGVEWLPTERIDECFAYHATIHDAVRRLLRREP
jgi:8-oxo-dGTP pyrophosphatase MutT (NUDIX family)